MARIFLAKPSATLPWLFWNSSVSHIKGFLALTHLFTHWVRHRLHSEMEVIGLHLGGDRINKLKRQLCQPCILCFYVRKQVQCFSKAQSHWLLTNQGSLQVPDLGGQLELARFCATLFCPVWTTSFLVTFAGHCRLSNVAPSIKLDQTHK
jgi:hypothetical protein